MQTRPTETFKIEKHHPKSFSLDMVGMTVGLLNLLQQICRHNVMSVHCCSVNLIRHFAVEASSVDHVLNGSNNKRNHVQHAMRQNSPHFMTKGCSEPSMY